MEDKTTRFDLAIECGNLDVALETAKAIDRAECWDRLAQQALKQGSHKVRGLRVLSQVCVPNIIPDRRKGLPTN